MQPTLMSLYVYLFYERRENDSKLSPNRPDFPFALGVKLLWTLSASLTLATR